MGKELIIDFFLCYLNGKLRALRRFKAADFGHSNYKSAMFLTKIYHLSTAGRVKLKLENKELPSI